MGRVRRLERCRRPQGCLGADVVDQTLENRQPRARRAGRGGGPTALGELGETTLSPQRRASARVGRIRGFGRALTTVTAELGTVVGVARPHFGLEADSDSELLAHASAAGSASWQWGWSGSPGWRLALLCCTVSSVSEWILATPSCVQ